MLCPQDNMMLCNLSIEKPASRRKQCILKSTLYTKFHRSNIHSYRFNMLSYLSNFRKVPHKPYRLINPSSNHQYTLSIKYFQFLNIQCKVIGNVRKSYQNLCNNIEQHNSNKRFRIHIDHMVICIENRHYYSSSILVSKINNEWLQFHKLHKDCCMQRKQYLTRRIQKHITYKHHPNNNSVCKIHIQQHQSILYIHQDKLHMRIHLSNNHQHKIGIEFQTCMFYINHYIWYKFRYY